MSDDTIYGVFDPYCIWVLAPALTTDDANIGYYYDFTQSIEEYKKVFEELAIQWNWQPVTKQDFKAVIGKIKEEKKIPLVLNLCDGDEVNNVPGVSVIKELERLGIIYTGADTFFYTITTSKIPMKRAFEKMGVSTAAWRVLTTEKKTTRGITNRIGTPIIIKPAVSGGSMGVAVKNVVHTDEEAEQRVAELYKGYRGWNLLGDGLFAERFITGREFTTFITGSTGDKDSCVVYEPVERVFHSSLKETERFLSFDRLWEIYEEEEAMPENQHFYEYKRVEEKLAQELKTLSLKAYEACGGKGYGRLDIRQEAASGELYVLEVNAQCGLSEDENYTSIGAIIKASGVSYTDVIAAILKDALRRSIVKEEKIGTTNRTKGIPQRRNKKSVKQK